MGLEVSGYSFWFEQMLERMGFELAIVNGEVARRRRQKNDYRDA